MNAVAYLEVDDVIFRDSVVSYAVACFCVSANYFADCNREGFCVFVRDMRVVAVVVFSSLDPFDSN